MEYTRSTHGVYMEAPRSPWRLHGVRGGSTEYTWSIHGASTEYTRSTHGVYTEYTRSGHGVHTEYTRSGQGLHGVGTDSVESTRTCGGVSTTRSPYIHSTLIFCLDDQLAPRTTKLRA